MNRYSLIYPQSVTLYQVDDQLYEPEEVATTNLFNTFLDALDGVSLRTCRFEMGSTDFSQSYCTYSAYGETGNDPKIDPVYPDTREGGYKGSLVTDTSA
jgi:tripeptidyl-peptidase-1